MTKLLAPKPHGYVGLRSDTGSSTLVLQAVNWSA